jgi:copper resistance protein C
LNRGHTIIVAPPLRTRVDIRVRDARCHWVDGEFCSHGYVHNATETASIKCIHQVHPQMRETCCFSPARIRHWRRAVFPAVAAVVLWAAPHSLRAHAIVLVARPAMNSSVEQGRLDIRLEFNSRIDSQRSRMSLQQPDGTEAAIAVAANGEPNVLAAHAETTMAGRWKLTWQVLSVDGHITRGEVNFSVRDRAH